MIKPAVAVCDLCEREEPVPRDDNRYTIPPNWFHFDGLHICRLCFDDLRGKIRQWAAAKEGVV